jgi:hypothetical protein
VALALVGRFGRPFAPGRLYFGRLSLSAPLDTLPVPFLPAAALMGLSPSHYGSSGSSAAWAAFS